MPTKSQEESISSMEYLDTGRAKGKVVINVRAAEGAR
jgi:hypothetical protein